MLQDKAMLLLTKDIVSNKGKKVYAKAGERVEIISASGDAYTVRHTKTNEKFSINKSDTTL